MQQYNILLADDHQLVLDGLVRILSSIESIKEIVTVNSGIDALKHPFLAIADLLIADIEMPGMTGIELLRMVKQRTPDKKMLIVSMYNNPGLTKEIIRLGGDGYLLKSADESEMQLAVKAILSGKKYFSQDVTMELVHNEITAGAGGIAANELTQREKEILTCIAQGLSNKQIAEKLFVAVKTVDTHRTNLMNKLDIHNVAGLTRFAIQHKLL